MFVVGVKVRKVIVNCGNEMDAIGRTEINVRRKRQKCFRRCFQNSRIKSEPSPEAPGIIVAELLRCGVEIGGRPNVFSKPTVKDRVELNPNEL